MALPYADFVNGLIRYNETDEHFDCTIICGPYHFKAHKIVVGAHSEYFRSALKADAFKEGKTGTIELKAKQSDSSSDDEDDCDEPEIVKLMMHYFYHFDYLEGPIATSDDATGGAHQDQSGWEHPSIKKSSEKSAESKRTTLQNPTEVHLIEHTKLFAMAVKYQIVALQRLAIQKFEAEARRHWDHEDLPRAIHLIYTTTPDEVTQLREAAVEILYIYYDYFVGRPDVQSLLRSINGLACDLLNWNHREEYYICLNSQAHSNRVQGVKRNCGECEKLIKVCSECVWQPNTFLCGACASVQGTQGNWS